MDFYAFNFADFKEQVVVLCAVVVIVEQGGQGALVGSVAKDVLDQYFFGASSSEAVADNTLVE